MMQLNLIYELHNIGVIQYGNFKLKNGTISNIYCDFKKIVSYPKLLTQLCLAIGDITNFRINNLIITGVPIGGYIYASGLSLIYNIPNLLLRTTQKKYGTSKLIEGTYKNQDLIIIDDVITSGNSVLDIIKILEQQNISIKEIIIILDREEGGVKLIKDRGYTVKTLFTLKQLQSIIYPPQIMNSKWNDRPMIHNINDIIKQKQSNLVFALDNSENINNALNLLDSIGPYIAAVKLHTDIFDFQNIPMIIGYIKQLKKKHNFLIIDDRKLSDIGHISTKQIKQITKWADLVTVYGITGYTMIQELNKVDIGLILIHNLSTCDNLLDNKYSYNIKKMAYQFKNVIGFITQEKVMDGLLNFSPGVNINSKTDEQGQLYNTPENMINKGTDLFIIGRGITDINSCLKYKKRCYY